MILKINPKSINTVTIVNLLSTFWLQAISFMTIPLFTRILGSSNYGIYSTFEAWMKLIVGIMGLGVFSSLGSGKYKFSDKYLKFCSSTLLFGTLIGCITVILGVALSPIIGPLINFPGGVVSLIFVSALSHSVVNFYQNVFCYEKKAFQNLAMSVFLSVSTVILSLVLIQRCDISSSYMGRVLGVTIPYTVLGVIIGCIIYFRSPTGLDKEYMKYSIMIGIPVVFHMISQNVLSQSDRVMMRSMGIIDSEIGIYSLFYTLTSVLGTLLNAFNNSWCPFFYEYIKHNKWEMIITKGKNYVELYSVIMVGYLMLSREVTYLMSNEEYWSGISIIPVLALAVYFIFLYQFPVNYEFYYGNTIAIAIGTAASGIINIVLNWMLIPLYGMYGASIATVISYIFLFILHLFIVRNMKRSEYRVPTKIFIPGFLLVLVGIILFYLLSPMPLIRWTLGIGIGCFELYRIYIRKSIF